MLSFNESPIKLYGGSIVCNILLYLTTALKVFVCLFFNMAGKIDKVFVSIGLLDYIFLQLHCALL